MSIYTDIIAAGIEVDHHESDLYFPVTPESTAILDRHPGVQKYRFTHEVTKSPWYEVPFMYEPFWEARSK